MVGDEWMGDMDGWLEGMGQRDAGVVRVGQRGGWVNGVGGTAEMPSSRPACAGASSMVSRQGPGLGPR